VTHGTNQAASSPKTAATRSEPTRTAAACERRPKFFKDCRDAERADLDRSRDTVDRGGGGGAAAGTHGGGGQAPQPACGVVPSASRMALLPPWLRDCKRCGEQTYMNKGWCANPLCDLKNAEPNDWGKKSWWGESKLDGGQWNWSG
jgi:hypothetical protein